MSRKRSQKLVTRTLISQIIVCKLRTVQSSPISAHIYCFTSPLPGMTHCPKYSGGIWDSWEYTHQPILLSCSPDSALKEIVL